MYVVSFTKHMCCKIEIHNTHDFYFILLSAWEYFPLGSYGCDVYAEYLNFSVQKVLLPSVEFCTHEIPIECLSHPYDVHHVYI